MDIPEISLDEAQSLHAEGGVTFVDVRDRLSYEAAHIPGAIHVDDSNVQDFVEDTDKGSRVVVYCYHGHASLGATAYFSEHGFTAVASMTGGFSAWHGAGGAVERSRPGA
jgi:thiosulfate sulfurtransferase